MYDAPPRSLPSSTCIRTYLCKASLSQSHRDSCRKRRLAVIDVAAAATTAAAAASLTSILVYKLSHGGDDSIPNANDKHNTHANVAKHG